MSVEHRVIGPPGTGKTRYLTTQAERAGEKYGPEGVAACSLTKAAAQELASRVEEIPANQVGTLHAHAFRGLEQPALAETPEALAEWNLHVETVAPALRIGRAGIDRELDPTIEGLDARATDGERLLAELSTRRARMEDPETYRGPLARFAELWGEWKRKSGRLDFTDLIERAIRDLDACPGRPAVMLLDEAQDLSRLEFELARRWGSATEQLVVCGDPFQNLYEWRGADPEAFWGGEVASERVLGQSYRLPRAVHAYASEWSRRLTTWRDIAFEPTDEEGEVRSLSDPRSRPTYRQPAPLLPEIQRDLDAGLDVMVLASCAFMLEPLERQLREAGIPFHNPYRPKQGAWNPLRGAGRLLAFLRPQPEVWGEEHRLWTWRDLDLWLDPLESKAALERGAKTLVQSKLAPDLLGDVPDSADQPAPLDLALSLVKEDQREKAGWGDVEWWAANLRERERRRYSYPLEVYRRRGGRALREPPRLVLGTIHSVKGGEADSVYVFPDLSRAALPTAGGPATPRLPDPVVRLFYVAFTRSRRRLTLLEPAGAEYAALPKPGGGTVAAAPRGKALSDLVRDQLKGDR